MKDGKQKAPAKAPKKSQPKKADTGVSKLASEVELLKKDNADLHSEVRELVELLGQQFGEPVATLAKKVSERHENKKPKVAAPEPF
jgi:DNA-binding ferritin-like protein